MNNKKCFHVSADDFKKIPGSPIAYWVGEKMLKAFEGKKLTEIAKPRQGLATGCNAIYLRSWYEISQNEMFIR